MGKVFSQEFKDQVVELHRRGRTFADIGQEFSLSPTSVANWVRAADRRQARADAGGGDDDLKAKVARLERELARKDEELEMSARSTSGAQRAARYHLWPETRHNPVVGRTHAIAAVRTVVY